MATEEVGSTDKLKLIAYALPLQALLLSMVLHAPWSEPKLYADIVGFYWRDFAEAGRVPYLDVDVYGEPFEYPAVAAAISILCGLIGRDLYGFYVAYCLAVLAFTVLMSYCVINFSKTPLMFLCLAAPSLVVYGIYHYDVIMAALLALATLLYARGRYVASAIALAASVHVKFYSILFFPYVLLTAPKEGKKRFLLAFVVAALVPVLALPKAYAQIVEFISTWGLEGTWLIYLFPDAAAPTGRILNYAPPHIATSIRTAQIVGLFITMILYLHILGFVTRDDQKRLTPEKFMAMALMTFLIGSPIYSPQMNITLLPFLPAVMTVQTIPTFILWELANISIILTWFTTNAPHLPWSAPQTAVLIRAIGLFLMFLQAGAMLGLFRTMTFKKLPFISLFEERKK